MPRQDVIEKEPVSLFPKRCGHELKSRATEERWEGENMGRQRYSRELSRPSPAIQGLLRGSGSPWALHSELLFQGALFHAGQMPFPNNLHPPWNSAGRQRRHLQMSPLPWEFYPTSPPWLLNCTQDAWLNLLPSSQCLQGSDKKTESQPW